MRPRRSLLFAPANRLEVHAKAIAAGADMICLDLEDAVPVHAKAEARAIGAAFLKDGTPEDRSERVLRINTLRSLDGVRDVVAVLEAAPTAGTLFLPKVTDAGEVRLAHDLLIEAGSPLSLGVLIETAEGLENAAAILAASDRIAFAMFGGADLAAELGVAVAAEPLRYARARLAHDAALSSVDLLDVPCLSFRDLDATTEEAHHAKMLGFTGKAALHPAGLPALHAVFSPTADEITRAEAIVEAYRTSPNGLAKIDGKIVDKPIVYAAERIVALKTRLAEAAQDKGTP